MCVFGVWKRVPVEGLEVRHVHSPHDAPNLVSWAVFDGRDAAVPALTRQSFMIPEDQFIILERRTGQLHE